MNPSRLIRAYAGLVAVPLALAASLLSPLAQAQSGSSGALADLPVTNRVIPGNMSFALSNEFPTNENEANWGDYVDTVNYVGYFDPNKCYIYQFNSNYPGQSYFKPVTHAGGANRHDCNLSGGGYARQGQWSGNFMNWASMQTIDPVRAVLTGGYRAVDRDSRNREWPPGANLATPVFAAGTGPLTVIEKAWNDAYHADLYQAQGRGTDKYVYGSTTTPMPMWPNGKWVIAYAFPPAKIPYFTPFSNWKHFFTFTGTAGNRMTFSPVDGSLWYPEEFYTTTGSDNNLTLVPSAYNYLYNPPDPKNLTGRSVNSPDLTETSSTYTNTGLDNNVIVPGRNSNQWATRNLPVSELGPPQATPSPPGCGNDSRYACFQVYIRVSVCDDSKGLDGQSLLESNCVYYDQPSPHYKPEGLFQQYSGQLRYSVFGYPYNDASNMILQRASMRLIGQTIPNTNPAILPASNPSPEWDINTGVMPVNPNPTEGATVVPCWNWGYPYGNSAYIYQSYFGNAAAQKALQNACPAAPATGKSGTRPASIINGIPSLQFGAAGTALNRQAQNLFYAMDDNWSADGAQSKGQSGFMNYVNKYGQYTGYLSNNSYKVWDIVDNLYFTALLYYENRGNPWYDHGGSTSAAGYPIDKLTAAGLNGGQAINPGSQDFPYSSKFDDPVQYRCQKNFILGVSDDHTWNGYCTGCYADTPGLDTTQTKGWNQLGVWVNRMGALEGINSGAWPSSKAGSRPSLAWPQWDGGIPGFTTSTYYTAGMAYMAHVLDIRPDLPSVGKIDGKVTVDTYWVDMTEYNGVEHLNPYLLAAKYGGFAVPSNFDPANPPWLSSSPDPANPTGSYLPLSVWNTSGDTLQTHLRGDATLYSSTTTALNGRYPRPDNYFTANDASAMSASLRKAFGAMASGIKSYSTAAALSSSSVAAGGSGSYAAQYSNNWTGTVYANSLTINPGTGATAATATEQQTWNSDGILATQLAMTRSTIDPATGAVVRTPVNGWDTNRRVLTWNPGRLQGVPFRWASLSGTQQSALYAGGGLTYGITLADGSVNNVSVTLPGGGADYVNYLRGDRTNEVNANIIGGANALRARDKLLGDIVDSKVTPVGPPEMAYADSYNPGYSGFKATYAGRAPMVYVGANDGMLHAFNGKLAANPPDTQSGVEAFAYVPDAMFQGPAPALNAVILKQAGNPTTSPDNLLTWLGNPHYLHHNSVDATPLTFDVDFDRTGANPGGTGNPDWRTLLIGGLGKGGSSFYALDVTDPDAIMGEDEAALASGYVDRGGGQHKFVLWEFTQPDMGYSYGAPVAVKTARYGWVIVLTSGYDKGDGATGGVGHLYLVNPRDGALLQKIDTSGPSNGLAQASAYVSDYTNYTADSVYAGDLNGNVWRFDLTSLNSSGKGQKLAQLTDPSGNGQPVTTAPLIEINASTIANTRMVLVGTGRLLDFPDANSTQVQSFYAIKDGTASQFNAIPTAPITRNDLVQQKDLTHAVTLGNAQGWYFDLGDTTQYPNKNYVRDGTTTYPATASAAGERVLLQPVANSGMVAFSTDLMTMTDSCLPVVSNIYVINYGTGQTSLAPNNVTYLPQTSRIVDLLFANASDGSLQLLAGDSQGGVSDILLQSSGFFTRVLNWRSVPATGN